MGKYDYTLERLRLVRVWWCYIHIHNMRLVWSVCQFSQLSLHWHWYIVPLPQRQPVEEHPDNEVHGASMGPTGSCRPQMGPMLTPWTWVQGMARLLVRNYNKPQAASGLIGYWTYPRTIHCQGLIYLPVRQATNVCNNNRRVCHLHKLRFNIH